MVKTRGKSTPDRPSPGQIRSASDVGVPGQPALNGLQDTGSAAERAGQRTAELLDSQPPRQSRKKWSTGENRDVMRCYYASNPSERGYRKRMHQLWLAAYPNSGISEQRLADQRSVSAKNKLLSDVELEEIQRSVHSPQSTAAVHDTSTAVEDLTDAAASAHATPQSHSLMSTHSQTTTAHETPPHTIDTDHAASATLESSCLSAGILTPNQLEMRDTILLQMQMPERVRLPALKSVQKKQMQEALYDVNMVLQTIPTSTIGETNQLIYSTAVVVTKALGFQVRKATTSNEPSRRSPPWKTRLEGRIKKW